jgi:hypothetical protein
VLVFVFREREKKGTGIRFAGRETEGNLKKEKEKK